MANEETNATLKVTEAVHFKVMDIKHYSRGKYKNQNAVIEAALEALEREEKKR